MNSATQAKGPADLIVHHGNVVTGDEKFRRLEAVAVKDGRIIAVADDNAIFMLAGPNTTVIDADGRTVLPGLYDSHVHPLGAATSELAAPLPTLQSLKDVFAYLQGAGCSDAARRLDRRPLCVSDSPG
jgi:predicted amidohydrolase YtcJ